MSLGHGVQVAAVVLFGAVLRLFRMNWESTWHDENFSLLIAWLPAREALAAIIYDYVHPPLYYCLLKGWMAIFGFGDYLARLLSALFGTLAIAAVYLLGRRLVDHPTGLLAAFLLAISQVGVRYSHEARMYSMAMFLTVCALLFFDSAQRTRRASDWAMFTGVAILMVYTHYYTILILLAIGAYGLLYRRTLGIPFRWWALGCLALAVAFLPWLFSGIVGTFLDRPKIHNLHESKRVHWFSVISAWNWFNNAKWHGLEFESPLATLPPGLLVFTLPAVAVLARARGWLSRWWNPVADAYRLMLPAYVCFGFVLAVVGGSALMGVQFGGRYLVMVAPVYYLLAAAGVTALRSRPIQLLCMAGAVVLAGGGLYATYFVRAKTDTRAAVAWLASEWRAPDCVCLMPQLRGPEPAFWLARAYMAPPATPLALEKVLADPAACPRLWIVWDRTFFMNSAATRNAYRRLQASFEPVITRNFFEVSASLSRPRATLPAKEPLQAR